MHCGSSTKFNITNIIIMSLAGLIGNYSESESDSELDSVNPQLDHDQLPATELEPTIVDLSPTTATAVNTTIQPNIIDNNTNINTQYNTKTVDVPVDTSLPSLSTAPAPASTTATIPSVSASVSVPVPILPPGIKKAKLLAEAAAKSTKQSQASTTAATATAAVSAAAPLPSIPYQLQHSHKQAAKQTYNPDRLMRAQLAAAELESAKIIDINADSMIAAHNNNNNNNSYHNYDNDSNSNTAAAAALTSKHWSSSTGTVITTVGANSTHKRKHQLNSLAVNSISAESEIARIKSSGQQARQLARAKYGW